MHSRVAIEREVSEMEVDMEMDVDDADAELVFEAREIDIDYEFDAAMFFDLTREESHAEAREAERWFERAQSYPPSRKFIFC